MGREYRVFPAVLVREQVLKNNMGATFLSFAEIQASVEQWNGMPVVERHPIARGTAISARSPEILDKRGVGFVFRARAEDNALKADIFLEAARVDALPDTKAYVENVDSKDPGEVSTGFFANAEKVTGTFGGEAYDLVLHGLRPDHLALLPDEKGACSVDDGCGLGVNCACGGTCKTDNAEPVNAEAAKGLLQKMVDGVLTFARKHKLVEPIKVIATNESDDDRRSALRDALNKSFGGLGKVLWVDAVFSDESNVVFQIESQSPGGTTGLYRSTYTVADGGGYEFSDPESVRRVTAFTPVANDAGAYQSVEKIMNREQMIAHLVANGRDKGVVEKLSDADLGVLCNQKPTASAPASDDVAILQARNVELLGIIAAKDAESETALQAERKQVLAMQERLIYEGKTAFTDKQIQNMKAPELRQLYDTVFPMRADYSGRGGPARSLSSNAGVSFDTPGILDAPAGKSVFDQAPNRQVS